MSRAPEAVQAELLALLPGGWAWPREPDTVLGRVLLPAAEALADVEASAEALLLESDPRVTDALLPDYERVLGTDPCLAGLVLSDEDRRRSVHQRWTARGGASIGYFERLAAAFGVPIAIRESRLSVAGEMQAGDAVVPAPEQFTWLVTMPPVRVVEFVAGASVAGDPLGSFEANFLECVIRRLAPAHTVPVFAYQEIA